MGYNKQLNDSYRIVYTDTGSAALPDIHTFDHTGVYSLIAKPSQLGKTVTVGFSCVSGGKTTSTTLAEGNYFVEYSELAANIYWNFSFLGKANSGADFTAQNTMVTYDKSKGTYTVKKDSLSGGGAKWTEPQTKSLTLKVTAGGVTGTAMGTDASGTATITADGLFYCEFTDILLPRKSANSPGFLFNYFIPNDTKFLARAFFIKSASFYSSTDGTGTALTTLVPLTATYYYNKGGTLDYGATLRTFYSQSSSATAPSSAKVSGMLFGRYGT